MWFEEADVLQLLAPKQRARPWSKWLLYPVLWILFRLRILGLVTDREIRGKLSTFFRSRWFEPPFDGDRFLALLFDGMSAMQRPSVKASSLLPPGHTLDLSVTVTDMLDIPVTQNQHPGSNPRARQVCSGHSGSAIGRTEVRSRIGRGNLPGLALAARATSSFPACFSAGAKRPTPSTKAGACFAPGLRPSQSQLRCLSISLGWPANSPKIDKDSRDVRHCRRHPCWAARRGKCHHKACRRPPVLSMADHITPWIDFLLL
jgi:hypothetical protein